MKLTELLEKIQDQVEDYEQSGVDPSDVEVLLAIQPGYPLTMAVAGLVSSDEVREAQGSDEDAPVGESVFWVVASDGPGSHNRSPYAPRAIWEVL